MKISILTLFPEMFKGPFDYSIIKHAQEKKLLSIEYVNIRKFGVGKHKIVDDKPYGGGAGMIMRADILQKAIKDTESRVSGKKMTVLLDPQGKIFNQKMAKKLSKYDHLVFIAGHYEGVDERVRKMVDEEISIGDYVLTGGEIPIMVVVDTIARLIPGVLGKEESSEFESFQEINTENENSVNVLEYPQYTRPSVVEDLKVPAILLSGDHKKIQEWRKKEAIKKTKKQRPDLLSST